jgi:hypothetical protein
MQEVRAIQEDIKVRREPNWACIEWQRLAINRWWLAAIALSKHSVVHNLTMNLSRLFVPPPGLSIPSAA